MKTNLLTNKVKQLLLLSLSFTLFSCSLTLNEDKQNKEKNDYAITIVEDSTPRNTVSTGAFNN